MPDANRPHVSVESSAIIMSVDDAEALMQRIKSELDSLADSYEAVMPLIRDAIDRRAYVALGYPTLTAYVSSRFGMHCLGSVWRCAAKSYGN